MEIPSQKGVLYGRGAPSCSRVYMLCMAMASLVLACVGTWWLVTVVGGTMCALPSLQSPWAFLPQLVGGSGMWAVLLLQGGGRGARVPFPELPGPLGAEKAEMLSWHLGDAAVLAKRLRRGKWES